MEVSLIAATGLLEQGVLIKLLFLLRIPNVDRLIMIFLCLEHLLSHLGPFVFHDTDWPVILCACAWILFVSVVPSPSKYLIVSISVSQGPHIASVTLAAYECGSTDFPEPPYPDQIVCPQVGGVEGSISLLSIMSKVRLEACMWVSCSLNKDATHCSESDKMARMFGRGS